MAAADTFRKYGRHFTRGAGGVLEIDTDELAGDLELELGGATGAAGGGLAGTYPNPTVVTVGTASTRASFPGGAAVAIKRLVGADFPYAAAAGDYILVVTTTASARAITLPTAPPNGTAYIIKDGSNGAATNNITISRGGSDTINSAAGNGATSYVIDTDGGDASLIYHAADDVWQVL